jgi:hypothetical protein
MGAEWSLGANFGGKQTTWVGQKCVKIVWKEAHHSRKVEWRPEGKTLGANKPHKWSNCILYTWAAYAFAFCSAFD